MTWCKDANILTLSEMQAGNNGKDYNSDMYISVECIHGYRTKILANQTVGVQYILKYKYRING